jgi:DNA-binding NarL/FixJ family response regulator
VTKNSAPETLVEAIRAVHAGSTFLSPDIAQRLVVGHAEANPLSELSAKEFEVFRLLARGHSVAEVATTLSLSQKTAANYQTQIKDKLDARTTAALVHIALRYGVIKAPES